MVDVISELRRRTEADQVMPVTFPVERETQEESRDDAKLLELMQKVEEAVTAREQAEARAKIAEQQLTQVREQHELVLNGMRENLRLAASRNMTLDETNIELKGKVSSSATRISDLESTITRLNDTIEKITRERSDVPRERARGVDKVPDFEFIPVYDSMGKTIRVEAKAK